MDGEGPGRKTAAPQWLGPGGNEGSARFWKSVQVRHQLDLPPVLRQDVGLQCEILADVARPGSVSVCS